MAAEKTMRAVVLDGSCTPEEMRVSKIPVPEAKPGWVLVKVHASGVNRDSTRPTSPTSTRRLCRA